MQNGVSSEFYEGKREVKECEKEGEKEEERKRKWRRRKKKEEKDKIGILQIRVGGLSLILKEDFLNF